MERNHRAWKTQTYTLDYGPEVKPAAPPRGFFLNLDGNSVQVGAIGFSKSGHPLITSVKYRGEDIAEGVNGVFVADEAGQKYDFSNAGNMKADIAKSGPLVAELRWKGDIRIDASYSVPLTVTAEMPNSKSWVKIHASVEDPGKRLRGIGVGTPLAFGPLPWTWDFGTSRWSYGSLRIRPIPSP